MQSLTRTQMEALIEAAKRVDNPSESLLIAVKKLRRGVKGRLIHEALRNGKPKGAVKCTEGEEV